MIPAPIIYRLSAQDRQAAFDEGATRERNAIRQRRTTTEKSIGDTLSNNARAAGAELAVARWLGRPWTARGNDFGSKAPSDVGGGVEVKWTARKIHAALLLKPQDIRGACRYRPFVLTESYWWGTAAEAPDEWTYAISGWIWGYEAENRGRWMKFWERPCWQVEKHRLHDPSEIYGLLRSPIIGGKG